MKYFIKKSGQEVKLGQVIEVEQKVNTSLGEGICKTEVQITPANIELLVKQGFLVQKDEKEEQFDLEAHWHKLKPYIKRFAKKHGLPLPEAILFFASLSAVSSTAHIQVLLEIIAEAKNEGKLGPMIFVLPPTHNFNVCRCRINISKNKFIPKFHSKEDAEEAYELIRPFLNEQ